MWNACRVNYAMWNDIAGVLVPGAANGQSYALGMTVRVPLAGVASGLSAISAALALIVFASHKRRLLRLAPQNRRVTVHGTPRAIALGTVPRRMVVKHDGSYVVAT
jgi:hypothetical protein